MTKTRKILLISAGEFSGIKSSIASALKRAGCEVIEVRHTLRYLCLRPLYVLCMILHALYLYKSKFRSYLSRTRTAYWVRSKVNQSIVDRHSNIDAVMLVGANQLNFYPSKNPSIRYCIFTDHINKLSKQLPNFGFEIPEKNVHPSWNIIEQEILQQQNHIFVLGSFVKDSMVEDYGIDPAKITVVGGGPNLDINKERDGFIKDFSGKNILFVGLDPARKGLPVLKKAFAAVLNQFPDARLNVVGVDGVDADGVFYHGKLKGEQLKKLFYMSQIFALPTFREPFGIVFLEAMWAKNVCIGTRVGAIPEIIEDGVSGYIVDPGEHDALAERIISLFKEPKRLEQMAERGYDLAKSKWTWDLSAQKILRALFGDIPNADTRFIDS